MAIHRRAKHRFVQDRMHQGEKTGHALLIVFTCGLWFPLYLARKRKIERGFTMYKLDR
jgi:hypothetical protein